MSKQVIVIGSEARKRLVNGINTLADAVTSTLGPNG
jgi:chaperonin GroEL (HSP60 family)